MRIFAFLLLLSILSFSLLPSTIHALAEDDKKTEPSEVNIYVDGSIRVGKKQPLLSNPVECRSMDPVTTICAHVLVCCIISNTE